MHAYRLQDKLLCYLKGGRALRIRRPWLVATLVVLACWVPYFLAFFPGMFGYNTVYQLYWSIGGGVLNTHHPLLHTTLLAMCMTCGIELFGSVTTGGMLYTVLQMAAMALMYGWVCWSLFNMTKSKRVYVLSVVWFGAFPINGMLAISCTKDSLFGALFAVFFVLLYQTLAFQKSKVRLVALSVFSLLTMALRNNQQYVMLVLAFVLLAIICRTRDCKYIAVWFSLLLALGAYNIVHGPVLDAMGVSKGSSLRESLSVPLQQLANVRKAEGNLTPEECEYIDELIPKWNDYLPGISDPVKSSLNSTLLQDDVQRFMTTYLQVVGNNKSESINAFLRLNYRQWYPFALGRWSSEYGRQPYLETNDADYCVGEYQRLGITRLMPHNHSCLPLFRFVVSKAFSSCTWDWVPITWPLMSTGAVVWWYILAIGWLLGKRTKVLVLPIVVLLLYWATLLLGPVTLARYEYPLWSCLPLLMLQVLVLPAKFHEWST